MNRRAFFDAARASFGTFSQSQVNGFNAILDEADKRGTPRNKLAYNLGTTWHETAQTMQPIEERGPRSYFDKYEPGTKIGRMLGNTMKGDGYRYRGRGLPQVTGRRNVAMVSAFYKVDFISNPELLLDPRYAVPILFDGMERGWWTGKSESDYIDDIDEDDKEDIREFVNARRVVNGTDKAALIAGYALKFEKALGAAGYPVKPSPAPPPVAIPPPPDIPVIDAAPPSPGPSAGVSVGGVAAGGAALTGIAAALGGWAPFAIIGVLAIAVIAFLIIRNRS